MRQLRNACRALALAQIRVPIPSLPLPSDRIVKRDELFVLFVVCFLGGGSMLMREFFFFAFRSFAE